MPVNVENPNAFRDAQYRAGHDAACSYQHGKEAPCSNLYICPLVLRICRKQKAGNVLDIGCGIGWVCRELVDAGFRVLNFQGVGRFPWLWKSMVLVARKEPEIQA